MYAYDTFINLTQCDLQIRKNQEIAISSKYEDRWKKQEKNIYDITLSNHEISKEKEKITKPKNKFIKRLTFTDEGSLEIDALLMCVALIFEYNELPNKHFHISKTIIDGLVEQYDGDYNKWFSNPRLLAAKFRETVSIYN